MGVFSALTIGASGLTAFGEAVRVVGDNIANVNTLGFKSQSVSFGDVLGQTVNVSRSNIANQVGNGVRIGAITRNQAQGSVEGTTNATDMAINGNGLFTLKDPATGDSQYTRAGSFFLDKSSNLINGQGLLLQGYKLDSNGIKIGSPVDVALGGTSAAAAATKTVTAGVSLDAGATSIIPTKTMFDPNKPASYTFKSDSNVFDSLGNKHTVSLYFTKVGADASTPVQGIWSWHAAVDGGQVTGGTKGTSIEVSPTVYNVANKTLAATGIKAGSIISPDAVSSGAVTFGQGTVIADETGKTATISSTAVAKNNGVWDPTKFTDFKTYASKSRGTTVGTVGAYTHASTPNISITALTQTANPNEVNDTYNLIVGNNGTQITSVTNAAGTNLLTTAVTLASPNTTLTLSNGVVLSAAYNGTPDTVNTNGGKVTVSGASAGTGSYVTGTNTTITGVTQTSNSSAVNAAYILTVGTSGTQITNVKIGTGANLLAAPVTLAAGANTLTLSNGVVLSANYTGPADTVNTGGGTFTVSSASLGSAGAYTHASTPNTSITTLTQTANPNGVNDTYTLAVGTNGTQITSIINAAGTNLLATAVTLATGANTLTLSNGVVLSAAYNGTPDTVNSNGGKVTVSGANAGGAVTDGLGLSSTGPYHIVSVGGTASGTATMTAGKIDTNPATINASNVATLGKQGLSFLSTSGALQASSIPSIKFTWSSSAAPTTVAFGFGTSIASGGTGTDGTVQLGGASATRFMNSDGFSAGFLSRLETDSAGRINGVFTNGQRRPLFQVALASFPNEAVLNKLGNNMLAQTIASGQPVAGTANNGSLGSIQPFALEKSNVDLANEFVKLIVIQRAYEANSKTILTTDQMLSALMTLKR